jgi:hypothetical protein
MKEEYDSIINNDVWTVVPRPHGKSVVTSKWIYKIKHAADGSLEKYKARFVARGFSQKEGIDYDEIFAPVARYFNQDYYLSCSNFWLETSPNGHEDCFS